MQELNQISTQIGEENLSEHKAVSIVQSLSQFLDTFEGKRPIKPELKFFHNNTVYNITVLYRHGPNR